MHKPLINISPHYLFGFGLAITLFELLTYMASDMIMPAMLTITHQL
ncbi:MAG: MFS transporter, partial [Pseudomonas sp.]